MRGVTLAPSCDEEKVSWWGLCVDFVLRQHGGRAGGREKEVKAPQSLEACAMRARCV